MTADALDILSRPSLGDAWLVAGESRLDARVACRRPTTTDGFVLIHTLAGVGRLRCDGLATPLAANDLLLVRADAPPSDLEPVDGPWHVGWFHVHPRGEWLGRLDSWPALAPGHARWTPDSREPFDRLTDARDLAVGRHPWRMALALNALEHALLLCCDAAPARADDRMSAVADWMTRNVARPVTLDGLAVLSGLSVSGLSHRFRAEIGVPPLQYLERQRMGRARELLSMTDLSVRDVALDVGYEDAAYFTARFRKANDCSPDAYRRRFVAPQEI